MGELFNNVGGGGVDNSSVVVVDGGPPTKGVGPGFSWLSRPRPPMPLLLLLLQPSGSELVGEVEDGRSTPESDSAIFFSDSGMTGGEGATSMVGAGSGSTTTTSCSRTSAGHRQVCNDKGTDISTW